MDRLLLFTVDIIVVLTKSIYASEGKENAIKVHQFLSVVYVKGAQQHFWNILYTDSHRDAWNTLDKLIKRSTKSSVVESFQLWPAPAPGLATGSGLGSGSGSLLRVREKKIATQILRKKFSF